MGAFGAMLTILVYVLAIIAIVVQAAVPAKCPPKNEVDVTLLPNPKDCKTYFSCQAGHPVLMNCPDGLYYNPDLRVCDWTIRHEKDRCLNSPPSATSQPSTSRPINLNYD